MFYELIINGDTYKLRLNTRNIIFLEQKLGCNPLAIFGNGDRIPTVEEMVNILFYSLQQLNHGINEDKAYDLFDKFIEEHSVSDFIPVIVEIYKISGLIPVEGKN